MFQRKQPEVYSHDLTLLRAELEAERKQKKSLEKEIEAHYVEIERLRRRLKPLTDLVETAEERVESLTQRIHEMELRKKEEIKYHYFIIDSTEDSLPENYPIEMNALLLIIKLISEKFSLNEVVAKYSPDYPQQMHISINSDKSGYIDDVVFQHDQQIIDFFRSIKSAKLSKEHGKYPRVSCTAITFPVEICEDILAKLQAQPSVTQQRCFSRTMG